jgi:hypothetical protein
VAAGDVKTFASRTPLGCERGCSDLPGFLVWQLMESSAEYRTDDLDATLAQAFSNGNGYFLTKPLHDVALDRVLESIAAHSVDAMAAR